jgi:hypothetical protein
MERIVLILGAVASALLACGEDRVISTPPPGFRQDVFRQEAASKIDVLWVIDNSASMQPHQDKLRDSLSRFIATFTRGLVDYRIAVTTTDVLDDRGEFLGNPPIVEPALPDPIAAFERNVSVGTGGKGHEEAFEAARLAITREQAAAAAVLKERSACEKGCMGRASCIARCAETFVPRFMRPGAHLYIVFVSDEEEQSFGEVRYYQRFFETALGLGNESAVAVATICGDVPTPRCKAQPGARYAALAAAPGGIAASVCDADFDRSLESLALDAAGLKRKFPLSKVPAPETLRVELRYRCDARTLSACQSLTADCDGRTFDYEGQVCEPPLGSDSGWTLELSTNSLFFHGDAIPGLRSTVVASYQAAEDLR